MVWLFSGTLDVAMNVTERLVNIYDLAVRYWSPNSWTLEGRFIICICDILTPKVVLLHRTYNCRCHCEEHHSSINRLLNSGLGCFYATSSAKHFTLGI